MIHNIILAKWKNQMHELREKFDKASMIDINRFFTDSKHIHIERWERDTELKRIIWEIKIWTRCKRRFKSVFNIGWPKAISCIDHSSCFCSLDKTKMKSRDFNLKMLMNLSMFSSFLVYLLSIVSNIDNYPELIMDLNV